MDTLSHISVACAKLPPPLPKTSLAKRKCLRPPPSFCLGENKGSSDLFGNSHQTESESRDDLKINRNLSQSTTMRLMDNHADVWKLFQEAQRNILYLNKQRIRALEELDKVKREKALLLSRLEQLKADERLIFGKDKVSVSSELLLRIDGMVISGKISNVEASELRRLVIDSRLSLADNLLEYLQKNDTELLVELRHVSEERKRKGVHVIHICAEMDPVISVGSLASYVTGLSRALQRRGHMVEVILPKYACLNMDEVKGLRESEAELYSFFNGQLHRNRIWTGVVYGIGVTFIQPIDYSSFFSQERVYGYPNDFERFTYFSRASLDYIVKSGKQPDVLHIHNWETSIVGPLFWDIFVNQGFEGTRILLTCQSLGSQYLEQPEKLALCGLDPSKLNRPDRLQDNKKPHLVNTLKGGIVYSNKVIFMSSMHRKDHIIRALGQGLESTLHVHEDKLIIAPHGIDKSIWDPSIDTILPESYSAQDMTGKTTCKTSLQQHIGLKVDGSMILVGCVISDLSDIDLEHVKGLVQMASNQSVQFIFMVYMQDPVMDREFESFQESFKGLVRYNKYDEDLLHFVLAGSDIMLCPSFNDPLLQVPLKALRYGSAPVPLNISNNLHRHSADNNFESSKFWMYINNSFGSMSLSQAIDEIKSNTSGWKRRIRDAMTMDFSWDSECSDIHASAYASLKNL